MKFNVKKIALATALVASGLSLNANATVTAVGSANMTGTSNPSYSYMSENGSLIAGALISCSGGGPCTTTTYYWPWQTATNPSTQSNYALNGLSSDGSIALLSNWNGNNTGEILLTATSNVINLATPQNATNFQAVGISSDNSIIIGYGSALSVPKVYLWNNPQGSGSGVSYTAHVIAPYNVSGSDYWTTISGLSNNGLYAAGYAYPQGLNVPMSSYVPLILNTSTSAYETLTTTLTYTGGMARIVSDDGLSAFGYLADSTNMSNSAYWSRVNTSSNFSVPLFGSSFATYTDSGTTNAINTMSKSGSYLGGSTLVGGTTTRIPTIWRLSDNYFSNIVGLNGYTSNVVRYITSDNRYVLGSASSSSAGTRYWVADIGSNASGLTFVAPNSIPYAAPSNNNNSSSVIDITNTNTSLANSAYQLNSVLNAQNMLLTMGLRNYDCQEFGENGYCAAVGGFSSIISSTRTRDTGLNLRVAKKVTDSFRVGLYLDQSWNDTLPSDFDINHSNPLVGAFVGYNENSDGTGLNAKLTASFGEMKASNTRNTSGLSNTEAGTGSSHFRSSGGQFELGYGKQLNDNWQAQPFFGARYVTVKRNGYTETDSVNFPVTYSSVRQSEFTGFIGVKLNGQLNEKVVLRANLIAEHGLSNHISDYVGTYADGNAGIALNSSSLPEIKRNRIVASAGADYVIDQRQRVSLMLSEQPLNVGTHLSAMATYMIGF